MEEALHSFTNQTFVDWEMIFVNDGSLDRSLDIAAEFAARDTRIKIYSKENGGINSARNFGFQLVSNECRYVLFSDADDILHKDFLSKLSAALDEDPAAGAAYCDYKVIDNEGNIGEKLYNSNRYVPTKFWIRRLDVDEKYTPFFSIVGWTPMIEPLTLLRKELFERYGKWDEINFPKGDTYGESIPLFGEIALNHNVIFVNRQLYNYRRHELQITNKVVDMKYVNRKIDRIWKQKIAR